MTSVTEHRERDPDEVLFICDFSPPRGPDPNLLESVSRVGADVVCAAYNLGKATRVNSAMAALWLQERGQDAPFTN